MRDLATDNTGDLIIEGGDLQLASGIALLEQQYREDMLVVRGEWAWDSELGQDWFGQILIKNPDIASLGAQFGGTLARLDGVSNVTTLTAEQSERTLSFAFAFVFTDPITEEVSEEVVSLGLELDDAELTLLFDMIGGV